MEPIGSIAEAISEGFRLVGQIIKGKEKAHMHAAIQAGEQYIFVNEGSGKYKNFDKNKKEKYLTHFRKRFFSHN